MEAIAVKCAVIGCDLAGLHRIRQMPGRLYCAGHFKVTAHKCMVVDRALRAVERRNEHEDNTPARIHAEM